MQSLGLYRHYKGGVYKLLLDSVTCEATGQRLVVYSDAQTGATYARPFVEFFGAIDLDGKLVSRFVEC